MSFAIYTHADCLLHETGNDHPEKADRLKAVLAALQSAPSTAGLDFLTGRQASAEELCRVHDKKYVDSVPASMPKEGLSFIDEDSPVSPRSYDAALVAAGTVCAAVDDIMAGKVDRAFCAVRPPGHHAVYKNSMGFCIFNNVAVGAAHALNKYGLNRVAVLDWDVHHGNGTQDIFQGRQDVLFISLQEQNMWPADEATGYNGENIMNFLMPVDGSADNYHAAFNEKIIPALNEFAPEMIFISAGFDSHKDDRFAPPTTYNTPPGMQNLTNEDYVIFTRKLMDIATLHAQGRLVSVLEGGYNIPVLAAAVVSHVSELAQD